MDMNVRIEKKDCRVSISPAAEEALNARALPLVAEVVVTLACCISKVVSFRDLDEGEELLQATPKLAITLVSAEHRDGNSETLPSIKNWNALAPRWLDIDFKNGVWQGDFGYSARS
jgi:hypothetical protein